MKQADMWDFGALLRQYPALPVTSATSGTAITTGQTLDRGAFGYAGSGALLVGGSYTASGAASGDLITVAGTISHSSSVSSGALVSPVSLQTFSVTVPWVSNATARVFQICVPARFIAANEYVALSSITLTATTVGTYSSLSVNALWVLGGEYITPDPSYVKTGYLSYGT